MNAIATKSVSNLMKSRILLSGPIPVADYMRLALTAQAQPVTNFEISKSPLNNFNSNTESGYYMKKDVFGQHGDFITSPEISQLFGEMLGVWGLQTWMQIGGPKKFNIVELGPGRGTLAKDLLNVFQQFEHITKSEVCLHLVEISPFLATVQHTTLTTNTQQNQDANLDAVGAGVAKTTGKILQHHQPAEPDPVLLDPLKDLGQGHHHYHQTTASQTGYPVYWYRDIRDLPQEFYFYIAHEFFDALPINKLQKVGSEWREVLVDVDLDKKDIIETKFRFVISRNETPVIQCGMFDRLFNTIAVLKQKYPRVLAQSRQHLEVSIDQLTILEELANRLDSCGGLASIIDYGYGDQDQDKENLGDSFRAFYKHELWDPLDSPGKADLTSDVDFKTIKELFGEKMIICGPVKQSEFLEKIGIELRLKMLMDHCKDDKSRESLLSGYKMIMDSNEMGSRFKVLSLFPKVLESHMPNLKVAGYS